jgi:putative transposase
MTNSEKKGYRIANQYAAYFLTFTVVGWVDLFTRKECRNIIIQSLKYCQKNKGLILNAYVIMPSHIHLIVRAEEASKGLSSIIRDFKSHTFRELKKFILNSKKESRRDWLNIVFNYHAKYNSNNTHWQIWKQDNRPKILLHPKFTMQKIRYIHNNPVVDDIVENPEDYLYSSSRNYLDYDDTMISVTIIDFGVQEGYVFI